MGEPIGMMSTYQAVMLGITVLAAAVFLVWLLVAATRRTPSQIPHKAEAWYLLAVAAIVLLGAVWSFRVLAAYEKPFAEPEKFDRIVRVYEFQWGFLFMPNKGEAMRNELRVEPGERILLEITANDVIHGFNIPALDLLIEVEPGQTYRMWFTAPDKPGTYLIQCTEYCGIGHYQMKANLVVGGES